MKLNELLGTEFPLIQGGMANIATGAFAAACSNAGALGIVASGGMDAPALREQIRAARALTDKPFGVNLMLMNPHIDEQVIPASIWTGGNPLESRCSPWWRPPFWPAAWRVMTLTA